MRREVRGIEADFKQSDDPKIFSDIEQQIKGLDISILVNNVGIA